MHQITDAELQNEMKRLLDGIAVKWLRPKLGVSRQTIYDWRAGQGISLERLQQVAAAVDRPLRLGEPDELPSWGGAAAHRTATG